MDAAFHLPTSEFLCDAFSDCFRIVIIAVFNDNDLDGIRWVAFFCPNAMAVIFANHHNQRHVVKTTKMREAARGVACTGTNQAFAIRDRAGVEWLERLPCP